MRSRLRISTTAQYSVYEVKQGMNLEKFTTVVNRSDAHFLSFAREEIKLCGVEVPESAEVLTWDEIPDAKAVLFLWEGRGLIASKLSPNEWEGYMIGNPVGYKPRPTNQGELLPYPELDSLYMQTLEEQTRRRRRAGEQRERRIK